MPKLNRRQQLLLLILFNKFCMLMTLFCGFWAFIHGQAFFNIPVQIALMRNAVNVVFFMMYFLGWVISEMWIKDMTTIPTFKIERGEKKPKADDKPEEGESLPIS